MNILERLRYAARTAKDDDHRELERLLRDAAAEIERLHDIILATANIDA